MTVLVEPYQIRESHRGNIYMCHECMFVASWEVRQMIEKPAIGYACGQHINEVLYLVETNRVNPPEGI